MANDDLVQNGADNPSPFSALYDECCYIFALAPVVIDYSVGISSNRMTKTKNPHGMHESFSPKHVFFATKSIKMERRVKSSDIR